MPLRSDVEAIDQPTVLYILYSMVSVQQTNLLHENASQNNAIFPKSRYCIYQTTLQCLSSFWLCNHHTTYIHYIQPTAHQLYMQCYKFNS